MNTDTLLTNYLMPTLAFIVPMLASAFVCQRIKLRRFEKRLPKWSNQSLRSVAFFISWLGTSLMWYKLVEGMQWTQFDTEAMINSVLMGLFAGIATPWLWKIFITVLNKRSPDLASALIVHYPSDFDHPKSGQDVTVLGFKMGHALKPDAGKAKLGNASTD